MIETHDISIGEICTQEYESETSFIDIVENITTSTINNTSDPNDKIRMFISLFKGRDDVYAKRWENLKKGTSGYSPVCANEWRPGVCQKSKTKCAGCSYKNYLSISEKVIDDHLRGRNNLGGAEESIMRLESPVIANELIKDIEK